MVGNPDVQSQPIESVAESSVSFKQKNVDRTASSVLMLELSRFRDPRIVKKREAARIPDGSGYGKAWPAAGSDSHIGAAYHWIIGEFVGRPAGSDAAGLNDEGMARQLERGQQILLDQQDRDVAPVDLDQGVAEPLDCARPEAEQQFVDHR